MVSTFPPVLIHIPFSEPHLRNTPGCSRCERSAMISLVPQTFMVNGNCLYLLYACLARAEMIKMLEETKIRLHCA